jgi:hypothetical protein
VGEYNDPWGYLLEYWLLLFKYTIYIYAGHLYFYVHFMLWQIKCAFRVSLNLLMNRMVRRYYILMKGGIYMDINKDSLEVMAGLFNSLEGKSEDEMISEVARMIRAGQGGITVGKARQMIQTILPMADRNQKRKLEKLLRSL